MNKPRILLVDDDAVDRKKVKRILGGQFVTDEAATGTDACLMIEKNKYEIVLLDYLLPDMDCVTVLECAKGSKIIVITGHGSELIAADLMRRGIFDYLPKVHLEEMLPAVIERALRPNPVRTALQELMEIQKQANEMGRYQSTD